MRRPPPRSIGRDPNQSTALTPSLMVGLVLFAIALTSLLAYRAYDASRAQRLTTEQTLREYAGFAAFQLKGATIGRMMGQHRQALDPVVRWINTRGPRPFLGADRLSALVRDEGVACRCLDGISFYYQVTFENRSIDASRSELSSLAHVMKVRDTVLAQVAGPSRTEPAFPNPRSPQNFGVAITSQYLVSIFTELDGRPHLLTHAVSVDTSGAPIVAYGFAVPAGIPVKRTVELVLASQPVLPPTLTKGLALDSLLAVTVTTPSGTVIYRRDTGATSPYSARDSLEARQGGLRFDVAINPDAASALIIGGLPQTRLPEILGTTVLAVGLLGLLLHQIRRHAELERLRNEFVSGVSHELRTPLAQIRLLAELLRLGKVPTEADRERSLRIIDQEARRLSMLVDTVLRFTHTRTEALSLTPIEVSAEIQEILAGFAPLAEARRVRLETRLAPELNVRVDRGALRQMLLNLLDNAVRYGPVGQTVAVATAVVGDRWTLEVSDEGPGVPPDERERIFAPYYRLARDSGGADGGTGIGLAVVRRLVVGHEGEITVHAASITPGTGARFVLSFPLHIATEKG